LVRQVLSLARGLDGQRVDILLRHLIDDFKGIISETFPRNLLGCRSSPGRRPSANGSAARADLTFTERAQTVP
jgi:hypothetical protein